MAKWGRIEGMREARKTLDELTRAVQRNVGKRALNASGEVFVKEVAARANVSQRVTNPTPGSLKASPRVVPARPQKGQVRVAVIVEDPASIPQEFGLTRRDYPADPFFVPAIEAKRNEAAHEFAEALKKEVDEAARRVAKRAG